ncbi:MAG: hypothetical protein IKO44_01235 [Ruminococcus sp.]|nr:hypothetical protein [Ruminococcus sp.]
MKKKIALISAALLLAGCSAKSETAEPIEEEFSCEAVITSGEREYTARIERVQSDEGEGAYSFVFTEPETVAGMSVSLAGDSCTVSLGEITETLERSELPVHGMLLMFSRAADGAVNGETEGKAAGIGYTAETEDGALKRLEFADGTVFEMK